MDFILTEAQEDEDQPFLLQFSDEEIEKTNFIDDASMQQESISLYRDPTIL